MPLDAAVAETAQYLAVPVLGRERRLERLRQDGSAPHATPGRGSPSRPGGSNRYEPGTPEPTFRALPLRAVGKAEPGRDSGKAIDEDRLRNVLEKARTLRNDIDHGRGGNIGDHAQAVVALRAYCHDLARLLILAKLGNRDRDAGGTFYGPNFVDMVV